MGIVLSLDTMTTSDKLAAIEQLWDDLSRHAENIPSPAWHGEVLEAREANIREGSAKFSDLDSVKERLGKRSR